jgi:hypothetical protein
MEIVAALRVKNEARWIEEVLRSVGWCAKTYVMDDHSDDLTARIACECGAFLLPSPFEGHDEGRDKTWLVDQIAREWKPGAWVLMIDGDEILEPSGERRIRTAIAAQPKALSFKLHVLYLWNSRETIRTDGVYSRRNRPSLFRMTGENSFRRTGVSGNLHCSCAPAACYPPEPACPADLWHLGYMSRDDRIRKWKSYNAIDPKNTSEGYDPRHPEMGSYPHMVQGDIPQIPAGARLKHAGPVTIEKFIRRS